MAIIKIPINNDNSSVKFRTDLEGDTYVLEFTWNSRLEKWHINIKDADENDLLMGVPLNINYNILQRFRIPELPQGLLMLFDSTNAYLEADRDSFGDSSLLVYEETS